MGWRGGPIGGQRAMGSRPGGLFGCGYGSWVRSFGIWLMSIRVVGIG
ncbi:hypothetical protein LINGRAPRIM_LOCUS808 [Linum grandiflorum]